MTVQRHGKNALAACILLLCAAFCGCSRATVAADSQREEVVFWHFWGGDDGRVVDDAVARFNASQRQYAVRAVAMPGNNLDLKLFLAVAGGDPPDVVNQDDPILADWALRGALTPLSELASPAELAELQAWLFPAARQLGEVEGRAFGLCNGLDIRALYYNATLLESHGLAPPRTLAELDRIAAHFAPPEPGRAFERHGFLPDARRLWAWGAVFGGDFYDEATGRVTCDDERIIAALEWMAGYSQRYGHAATLAFRGGDQRLPGQQFPLFAGRYAVVMDGQWRVRDIAAAQAAEVEAGKTPTRYGVCPLPPPPNGRAYAGWVNGNFFVVPRGARCKPGAWAFMKFWTGFGAEREAAQTCAAGGWIPVARAVVDQPEFQAYLKRQPLFAEFVIQAESPHQAPTPNMPGAGFYFREVLAASERALYDDRAPPPAQLLRDAAEKVQHRIERLRKASHAQP